MVVAQLPSLGHLPAPGALSSVTLLPATAINLGENTPTLAPPQRSQPTGSTAQQAKGVSLSPATEPFPPKLVERIRAGQFVEMRELLTDNIALLHQLESLGACQYPIPSLPGILKPRLREVTSLTSWMFAFLAYVAILSDDTTTRNMLAYARLVIREAQRHGGNGWIAYDKVFRQQAAIDSTLQWNTIHPGIQASTLLGQTPGQGVFCTLCREPDHKSMGCALSYLQEPQSPAWPIVPTPAGTAASLRGRQSLKRRQTPEQRVCRSWNRGECMFQNCNYRHVCASCSRQHKARDCPDKTGNPAQPRQ